MREASNRQFFAIGIVAKMVKVHPQTIRYYERLGLLKPQRTEGNTRLFSSQDVEILQKIQSYTDLGVNLAGVEMLLHLLESMEDFKKEMKEEKEQLLDQISQLRKLK